MVGGESGRLGPDTAGGQRRRAARASPAGGPLPPHTLPAQGRARAEPAPEGGAGEPCRAGRDGHRACPESILQCDAQAPGRPRARRRRATARGPGLWQGRRLRRWRHPTRLEDVPVRPAQQRRQAWGHKAGQGGFAAPVGISGKAAVAPAPRVLDRLETAKCTNFRQNLAGSEPGTTRVRHDRSITVASAVRVARPPPAPSPERPKRLPHAAPSARSTPPVPLLQRASARQSC